MKPETNLAAIDMLLRRVANIGNDHLICTSRSWFRSKRSNFRPIEPT